MLLFSYLFSRCQAFYFFIVDIWNWTHICLAKDSYFLSILCLWDFHPIVQVMVYFTEKDKLYPFARKKTYSAKWSGLSKKYKY